MLIVVVSIRQVNTSKNEYPALLFPRVGVWICTSRSLLNVRALKNPPRWVREGRCRLPSTESAC
jgi:hypothetical protein